MRVLLIANIATHERLVNGALGTVIGWSDDHNRPSLTRLDRTWYEIVAGRGRGGRDRNRTMIVPPTYTLEGGRRTAFPSLVWIRFDDVKVGASLKHTIPAQFNEFWDHLFGPPSARRQLPGNHIFNDDPEPRLAVPI